MKGIIYLIILILTFFSTFAQNKKRGAQFLIGTDLGFKAGIGTSSLVNSTIKRDEQLTASSLNMSTFIGGKLGFTMIHTNIRSALLGVYVEILSHKFKQNYMNMNPDKNNTLNYNKTLSYKAKDLSFMTRFVKYTGLYDQYAFYFDAGYTISTLKSLTESNSIFSPDFNISNVNYSTLSPYNQICKSLTFNTGLYLRFCKLGIKANYTYSGLMKSGYYPICDGIFDNNTVNQNFKQKYQNPQKTNQFSIELTMEINLRIFAFGRCSGGIPVFLFIPGGFDKTYFWGGRF